MNDYRKNKHTKPLICERSCNGVPMNCGKAEYNSLEQDFTAEKSNEKWVGDIIYIPTDKGWLYMAGVEDLFQREDADNRIHRDFL